MKKRRRRRVRRRVRRTRTREKGGLLLCIQYAQSLRKLPALLRIVERRSFLHGLQDDEEEVTTTGGSHNT